MCPLLLLLLACGPYSILGADPKPAVAATRYGEVRGRVRVAENGAVVHEYLGIPYSIAPVGDLRFKPNKRYKVFPKEGIDALTMPPACPQYSEQPLPWSDQEPGQSEDCLYLNIWAPANVTGYRRRPVKIYIHGGGWIEGGSNRMGYYDGYGEAIDSKDEDGNFRQDGIVVVTVNYRLGALGFATSGTEDAPGNAGLADLKLAFEFVFRDIPRFGGDNGNHVLAWLKQPDENESQVTLVGQGTGAILASLLKIHLSIPEFKTKSVLNGPNFLSLKAMEGVDEEGNAFENNLRLTNELAEKLNCPTPLTENPNATMQCLRGVEASRLMQVSASLSQGRGPPNVFLPQTKGPDNFFPDDPYMALHSKKYVNADDLTPTLATFTSHEGSPLLASAFPKVFGALGERGGAKLSAACAKAITRKFLKKFPQSVADSLLCNLDTKPTDANREKVIRAFGDAFFYCPMVFYAEEMKTVKEGGFVPTAKFYMLKKEVHPPYNPWADWMGSVGFSNVQIDFLHTDGQLILNNQTYTYTDEQSEQARANSKMIKDLIDLKPLPFDEFTLHNPAYGIMNSDGSFSEEKKTNFHKRNCEILRPYFQYSQGNL